VTPQSEVALTEATPAPRGGRAARAAIIAIFLASQIALPIRYYLGNQPDDERFAWRMFSSLAMRNCVLTVEESTFLAGVADKRVLNLNTAVQARWIGVLETNHPRTVDKFLKRRCLLPEVRSVRIERLCFETDGARSPVVEHSLDCPTSSPGRPA
jgi:hypothetical protein